MKKNQSKFRKKLHDKKDFPKIKTIPKKLSKSWGKGKFVLPSPLEVNTLMKKVPKGKLTTINELRKKLAKKHKTTTACPIVTGIFAWIAANAAEEDIKDGRKKVTPYWRTIKSDGKINEKYPGGISLQKKKLVNEKHEIVPRGKNYFVKNFENKLAKL
jgi:CO dehydrogenase/acetyl-CoA synthase alpha subunit